MQRLTRLSCQWEKAFMKNFIIQFLTCAVILYASSCKKPEITNPPAQNEFLYSWTNILNNPGDPILDVWFISATEGYYISSSGIYQSDNSGNSWSKIVNNSSPSPNFSVVFVNNQFGFTFNFNQIQLTRDSGHTWLSKSLPTNQCYSFFFVSPSTGYYGDVHSGIYKTTDSCNTWVNVYQPKDNSNSCYYIFFQNADTGYFFTNSRKLYKTINGAASWQLIENNIDTISKPGIPWNTLLFTDVNTGYYASDFSLLKTTDGGFSWNVLSNKGGEVNLIKFTGSDTGYYSCDSVINKTTDAGKSWTKSCQLSNGIFTGITFINSTNG